MKRLALLLVVIACGCAPAISQVNGFVARVYQQAGQTMPYRVFIPPVYKKSSKYPLIIWLHGGGGSGSDNLRQIQGDQIPGTRTWTANQAKHPAFVVVQLTSHYSLTLTQCTWDGWNSSPGNYTVHINTDFYNYTTPVAVVCSLGTLLWIRLDHLPCRMPYTSRTII